MLSDALPDDVETLKTALMAARAAAKQAEARAAGAEAMVAHLKLMIAKLRRDQFGQSSERSRRLLDQFELQLEELEADAAEDDGAAVAAAAGVETGLPDETVVQPFTRRKPMRAPLPAHLPR